MFELVCQIRIAGFCSSKLINLKLSLKALHFSVRDVEPVCTMDFINPKGKVWLHPPIVGLDAFVLWDRLCDP